MSKCMKTQKFWWFMLFMIQHTLFFPLLRISRHKVNCSSVNSCFESRSLNSSIGISIISLTEIGKHKPEICTVYISFINRSEFPYFWILEGRFDSIYKIKYWNSILWKINSYFRLRLANVSKKYTIDLSMDEYFWSSFNQSEHS